jgi:hypothetical protein
MQTLLAILVLIAFGGTCAVGCETLDERGVTNLVVRAALMFWFGLSTLVTRSARSARRLT